MDTVQVKRTGSDTVELWIDESQHLVINRDSVGLWVVMRHRRGVLGSGVQIDQCATADEAIKSATAYLQKGKDDLDAALRNSGLR